MIIDFLNQKRKIFFFNLKIKFLILILILLRFFYLIDNDIFFVLQTTFQLFLLVKIFFPVNKTNSIFLGIILYLFFLVFYILDSNYFFQESTDNLTKGIFLFTILVLIIELYKTKTLELFLPSFHFLSFSFYLSVIFLYKHLYKTDYELLLKLNILILSPFYFLFLHLVFLFQSYFRLKLEKEYIYYTFSKYFLIFIIFILSFGTFYFYFEWKRIKTIFQTFKILRIEQNYEITKIPDWLSLSLKLDKSFLLYEFLNQKEKKNFILTKIIKDDNWNYPINLGLIESFFYSKTKESNFDIKFEKMKTEIYFKKKFFEVKTKFFKPFKKNLKLYFSLPNESIIQNKYPNIKKINSYLYEINFQDAEEFEFVYFQKLNGKFFKSANFLNLNSNATFFLELIHLEKLEIHSKNYHLEKNFETGNYFATGKYHANWEIEFKNADSYKAKLEKVEFDEIVFLMNDSLNNKDWLKIYENIYKSNLGKKFHLVNNSWFTPRNFDEAKQNILVSQNPKTHLIPFNLLNKKIKYLFILSIEEFNIELKNLRPSYYYLAMIDFFKLPKRKLFIYNLKNNSPSYIKDLINYGFIEEVKMMNENFLVEKQIFEVTENLELNLSDELKNFITENSQLLEDFSLPNSIKESYKTIIHEFK